jgi:hypothetical protein
LPAFRTSITAPSPRKRPSRRLVSGRMSTMDWVYAACTVAVIAATAGCLLWLAFDYYRGNR